MSDRRLWHEQRRPPAMLGNGLRCQTSRYSGKPLRRLHARAGSASDRRISSANNRCEFGANYR